MVSTWRSNGEFRAFANVDWAIPGAICGRALEAGLLRLSPIRIWLNSGWLGGRFCRKPDKTPFVGPEQWNPPCCTNSLMKQGSVLPSGLLSDPRSSVPEGTVVGGYPSRSGQIVTLKTDRKAEFAMIFWHRILYFSISLGGATSWHEFKSPKYATWIRPCKPSSVTPRGWVDQRGHSTLRQATSTKY